MHAGPYPYSGSRGGLFISESYSDNNTDWSEDDDISDVVISSSNLETYSGRIDTIKLEEEKGKQLSKEVKSVVGDTKTSFDFIQLYIEANKNKINRT